MRWQRSIASLHCVTPPDKLLPETVWAQAHRQAPLSCLPDRLRCWLIPTRIISAIRSCSYPGAGAGGRHSGATAAQRHCRRCICWARVTLNFFATIGICGFFFQRIEGQDGFNYAIPLYTFIFLVALGADYTIFLMSRVREEAQQHGLEAGVPLAVARTGGVITSAGLNSGGYFCGADHAAAEHPVPVWHLRGGRHPDGYLHCARSAGAGRGAAAGQMELVAAPPGGATSHSGKRARSATNVFRRLGAEELPKGLFKRSCDFLRKSLGLQDGVCWLTCLKRRVSHFCSMEISLEMTVGDC